MSWRKLQELLAVDWGKKSATVCCCSVQFQRLIQRKQGRWAFQLRVVALHQLGSIFSCTVERSSPLSVSFFVKSQHARQIKFHFLLQCRNSIRVHAITRKTNVASTKATTLLFSFAAATLSGTGWKMWFLISSVAPNKVHRFTFFSYAVFFK